MADISAGGSLFLWATSHALQWMPVLQAVSLFVAIVAGVFAICVHLKRLMQ